MKIRRRRIIYPLLALLLGVFGLFFFFSTVTFDISEKIPEIKANVKRTNNLYGEIDMKRLRIRYLPRPVILVEGFHITNDRGLLIDAPEMSLKLQLLPVLQKKYRITKLSVSGGKMLLHRYADGTINFQRIVKQKLLDIKVLGASFEDTRLTLVDDMGTGKGLLLEDSTIEVDTIGKKISLAVRGRLGESGIVIASGEVKDPGPDGEEFEANGSLKLRDFDLKVLEPYAAEKVKGFTIGGTATLAADFSIGEKTDVSGNMHYTNLAFYMPNAYNEELRSESGSFDIRFERDSLTNLQIDNIALSYLGAEILGKASFGGEPDDPRITLNLKTERITCNDFKRLLPLKVMPVKLSKRIRAFDVDKGEIEVRNLSVDIRNSYFKDKKVLRDEKSFFLDLYFTDATFAYTGFDKRFHKVSGAVILKGPDLLIRGMRGGYDTATIDGVEGEVLGIGRGNGSYSIRLNGEFEGKDTLPELKKFSSSLAPVFIEGPVRLKANISGVNKEKAVHGSFGFLKNSLKHKKLPIGLTDLTGSLEFSPERLVFKEIRAKNKGSILSLDGKIDISGSEPVMDLAASGVIKERTANDLLDDKTDLELTGGSANYKVLLKGRTDALNVQAQLDLTPTGFAYRGIIAKKAGAQLRLKSETFHSKKKTQLKKIELMSAHSSIKGTGYFSNGKKEYRLDIAPFELALADLGPFFALLADYNEATGVVVASALKIEKKLKNDTATIDGEVGIENGHIKLAHLDEPIDEISFTAKLEGRGGHLSLEKLKIGKSSLEGSINLSSFGQAGAGPLSNVEFNLFSPHLDLADVMPRSTLPVSSVKKSLLRGKGKIFIREGKLLGQDFKALNTEVSMDKEAVIFNPLVFSLHKGLISGKATYLRDRKKKHSFETDLSITGLDVETLLTSLGATDKLLSGNVDARVALNGLRERSGPDGIIGKISFTSHNGKLWKFDVLTKVFSLINIISINELFERGMSYDTITGTFNFKDGIASSEDLYFDSNSLRMSSLLSLDLKTLLIDATLGFHPFVTIDKIITKIPIAGWIIAGNEKSSISMYYEIKGPVEDPEVKAVPVKSIRKGILGLLQRTLATPIRPFIDEKEVGKHRANSPEVTEEKEIKEEISP